MPEKILITGIAGFVGANLARSLLNEGYEVSGLDIVSTANAFRLKDIMKQIKYRWQSIHDVNHIKADLIIHLASQADVPLGGTSPVYTCEQNIMGTLRLLNAVRPSKTPFIYMSSESVYGLASPPIDEKTVLQPSSIYGASKAAADILTRTFNLAYHIPTLVLRSGTLFGEQMRMKQVVSIFLKQCLLGEDITVHGGSQTRDFNYISNYIDGIMSAIEGMLDKDKDLIGEVLNVASGRESTILELAELCAEITGSQSEIEVFPFREGEEGIRLAIDISKAMALLNWKPKITLEEGLLRTAEWLEQVL